MDANQRRLAALAILACAATPAFAQDEPERRSLITDVIDQLESGEAPEPEPEAMLERAAAALIELRGPSAFGDGRLETRGTAFFVTEDGLVVTSLEAVEAGDGLVAVCPAAPRAADPWLAEEPPAEPEPLPLQVLATDDALRLAIVRVEPAPGSPAFECLTLADAEPPAGTPVWALGAAAGPDPTVVRGNLTGTGDTAIVPESFAAGDTYAPEAPWLAVEGRKVIDDAGGPVVDAEGRVVGVNTRLGDHATFYALSSLPLADAVRRVAEAAGPTYAAPPEPAE